MEMFHTYRVWKPYLMVECVYCQPYNWKVLFRSGQSMYLPVAVSIITKEPFRSTWFFSFSARYNHHHRTLHTFRGNSLFFELALKWYMAIKCQEHNSSNNSSNTTTNINQRVEQRRKKANCSKFKRNKTFFFVFEVLNWLHYLFKDKN